MDKNIFQKIEPTAKMPKSSKQEVLGKIETAKLLLDFWDLFASKRVEMNLNTIKQIDNNKNK